MTKQKHIVVLSTSYKKYDRRMIRITQHLESLGHRIAWLSRTQDSAPKTNDTIKCRFKSGIPFYLEYNHHLFYKLIKMDFDMLYIVDLDTMLAGRLAAFVKRKPFIYDSHEYFTEVPELTGKPFKQWIWTTLGKLSLRKSPYNITVNQSLADILSKKYNVPFEVVRNTPDEMDVPRQQPQSPKVILYLGAVNEGRGLEIACESMETLGPGYQLWVVGDGDLYTDLSAKYGDSPNITFYGWVAPVDLPDYLSKAWIGINMLEPKSQSYYYSLTNKFFDYVQAKLPAIHMAFPEYKLLTDEHPVAYLAEGYQQHFFLKGVYYFSNQQNYVLTRIACKLAAQEWKWQQESKHLTAILQKKWNID